MVSQKSCDGVPDHLNPRQTPKLCAIAHENGQKCPKSRVFTMPLESCTGGHGALKSYRDPNTVCSSTRKRPEVPEITSFYDSNRVVYRGSRGIEIFPGPKTVCYSARKRPDMPEITNFWMPLESCTGGHGAFNSFRDPKIMDYKPRKRSEMSEIMRFYDFVKIV